MSERLRRFAPALEGKSEHLTDREIEVVRLMSGGYSNKEIAHALGTAEGTIKNHVSNILAKFEVRDRTRAVLKALEAGLLWGTCSADRRASICRSPASAAAIASLSVSPRR